MKEEEDEEEALRAKEVEEAYAFHNFMVLTGEKDMAEKPVVGALQKVALVVF